MSKNKAKEKNEKKLFKIITLGDSGVGKTCKIKKKTKEVCNWKI